MADSSDFIVVYGARDIEKQLINRFYYDLGIENKTF